LVPESALQPGQHSYNDCCVDAGALLWPGLMGLGVTALVADLWPAWRQRQRLRNVWTYDIYRHLSQDRAGCPLRSMGRWCTIMGWLSASAQLIWPWFASIMDYVQALFSFFIAHFSGPCYLACCEARTPLGGFLGLLAGTLTAIGNFLSMKIDHDMVAIFALSRWPGLAQDMYQRCGPAWFASPSP